MQNSKKFEVFDILYKTGYCRALHYIGCLFIDCKTKSYYNSMRIYIFLLFHFLPRQIPIILLYKIWNFRIMNILSYRSSSALLTIIRMVCCQGRTSKNQLDLRMKNRLKTYSKDLRVMLHPTLMESHLRNSDRLLRTMPSYLTRFFLNKMT